MICTICEAENKDGAKFCSSCGAALVNDQDNVTEASVPKSPEAQVSVAGKFNEFVNKGIMKFGVLFPIAMSAATVILITVLLLPWK